MEIPQNFDSFSKRFVEHAPYPVFFVNEVQRVRWLNRWAGKKESVSGGPFFNCEIADVLFDWGIQADEVGEVLLCLEEGYPQRVSCSGDSWLSVDVDIVVEGNGSKGFIVILLPRRFGDTPSRGDENVHRLIDLMTHEARGQLHAISGYCELLQTGELRNSGLSEELNGILTAKNQLSNLWDDAEDLVELFGDLDEPNKERFSLKNAVSEIVSSTAEALAKVGNEIQVFCDGSVPAVLIGNHQDFKRLVRRLIIGVGRYELIGVISVRISWANPSRLDKSALRLDIGGDKGPHDSIDWVELEQDVDTEESSGVRMTIVRRLMDRIGGRLIYKSLNGSCKRVTVDLKCNPSFENGTLTHFELDEGGEAIFVDPVSINGSVLSGLRLIVVDDNEVTIEVNRKLLQQLGATDVSGVKSGREALELHAERRFDIAFLDLRMPDMDGYELARLLRSQSSEAHIKIVAITAGSSRDSREKSLVEGFDECLIKPVMIMELRDVCYRLANNLKSIPKRVDGVRESVEVDKSVEVEVEVGFSEQPILCLEEWKNDPALHKRMLAMLLEDAPQTLKRIEDEVLAKDCAALERVVHYFKGSVDVVRADRLSAVSHRVLALLKTGDNEAALDLLVSLPQEYQKFTEYLQEIDYLEAT